MRNRNGFYRATAIIISPARSFSQPELAAPFERIAKHGAREFYQGETAKKFNCGDVSPRGPDHADDLEKYKVSNALR